MQEQLYWTVVPTKPYRLPENHEPFVSPRVLAEPVKDGNRASELRFGSPMEHAYDLETEL